MNRLCNLNLELYHMLLQGVDEHLNYREVSIAHVICSCNFPLPVLNLLDLLSNDQLMLSFLVPNNQFVVLVNDFQFVIYCFLFYYFLKFTHFILSIYSFFLIFVPFPDNFFFPFILIFLNFKNDGRQTSSNSFYDTFGSY
uniref:Uncharacterized protein n=1 Tax=Brugia timori TaxID=42155 RepID=A0A0R3QAN0_9BILA